ncbi:MAG: hypothetical protein KDH20_05910 [Rhodocyclaceae bacterium]|nr:hypothetical protein [Rhodocyclaceae bacterium]
MPNSPRQFGQLRLVGRVSLWFAGAALAGLAGVLLLARPAEGDYVALVQNLSLSRQQLLTLMLIGGLVLAIGTALTTWLIALYSSFRVAGPLHRFCLDLEHGIREGEVPRVRLRVEDDAQEDARRLEETVQHLYRHYDEIAGALESASLQIRRGAADDGGAAVERLRRLVDEVRL